MTTLAAHASKSRAVRAKLGHPVIDADGHSVEFAPPLEDYVRAIGGSQYAVRYMPRVQERRIQWGMTDQERLEKRATAMAWWVPPTASALDRATSQLPKLMYERMDDFGLDYAVLYPTFVHAQVYRVGSESKDRSDDPELSRVARRANNAYRTDLYREYGDRLTAAVGVSMQTPEEALEDLDYAINVLKAKVISISGAWRPIKPVYEAFPGLRAYNRGIFDRPGMWLDNFGIDSPYDYDPFWAKCVELGVPVTGHGVALGFTTRASPSNHCYNHIGAFADAGEALCKALFFGGVTRRFPQLRVGLLEGGVGTAARLYCDLFAHWEKRGAKGIQNCNPNRLDRQLFYELHEQFGGKWVEGRLDRVLTDGSNNVLPEDTQDAELDDFVKCKIERREDIRDLFVPNFFFGCEADDPMNAVAFNAKLLPCGVHLNAMFSSDLGHWDVPDMTEVVEEAYELVEDGLLTPQDLREFTFSNAVKFFAGSTPDFFKGTRIERETRDEFGRVSREQ